MLKRRIGPILIVWLMYFVHITLFAEIPAGYYYSAHNKKKDVLKTSLHQLAYPHKVLKYGSGAGYIWEGFYKTDRATDNSVIDMYSDSVRYFNGNKSVSGMHIEHSLPKSWWGGHEWTVYTDLFHLYPSDGTTNMSKSNNPLGIVTGTPTKDNGVSKIGPASYSGYVGNVFEPADEFKGDFARSYFYVSAIYEDLAPYWNSPMMSKTTYPVWIPWAKQLLMQWHLQDPVSIKEKLRQEAVYSIQGNRNPFIDYPDLVNYIWGSDTLTIYPFETITGAYLISPNANDIIDFGVILREDALIKTITVKGININSDLSVMLKNNQSGFSFAPAVLPATNVIDGINIDITFHPLLFGTYVDTLTIQGGGLQQPVIVPLIGKAANDFMVLEADEKTPVGARLNWITDPHAINYHLKVYEGALKAGNLIISSYVEGSSYNKVIELYNGTGKTIDLSDYTLQKQSNGTGAFYSVFQLSGSLPDKQTYLVAHNDYRNTLKAQAQVSTDSVMSFNGNDAIGLYQNGMMVDVVGYADAGLSMMWGLDITLKRKSTVTYPSASYDESEWESYPVDYFAALGSHAIQFQDQEITIAELLLPNNQSHYSIIGLKPEKSYHYLVESVTSGEVTKSTNTMQFKTTSLSAPEVNAASEISNTRFIANWDADVYTNNYLLDVFQYMGSADLTGNESFNQVGTNGKPLPDGWTGTASGNYTTTASSGIAPPSISLKNTGEWLQTNIYPHPIKSCSFMYKWASTGTGSHFIVEGLKGDEFIRLDSIAYASLSKIIANYTFGADDHITAIKITYAKKGAGNLAFDDFTITYGSEAAVYLIKDMPVSNEQFVVDNLTPQTSYYYNVRSTLDGSISPYSEDVKVTTHLGAGTNKATANVKFKTTPEGVQLAGLSAGDQVRVYSMTGIRFFQGKTEETFMDITLSQPGIYIIWIQHKERLFNTKFIK